jgi:hypothetical protein
MGIANGPLQGDVLIAVHQLEPRLEASLRDGDTDALLRSTLVHQIEAMSGPRVPDAQLLAQVPHSELQVRLNRMLGSRLLRAGQYGCDDPGRRYELQQAARGIGELTRRSAQYSIEMETWSAGELRA